MSGYAIEIKDLQLAFSADDAPLLKGCDMHLSYGEFVLLSGMSGSGKSTLLSVVNGVIPNAVSAEVSGSVKIDGKDIVGSRIAEISRSVGSVLQNADSQIVHTVIEDEIAFGCENRAMPVEEIQTACERACRMMQLDKTWSTTHLSGGQKQRLITASTLAMGQKILIFDEPLANLDKAGAQSLLSLLCRLCREENYAVLLVEHRFDVALPYVDRLLWLEDGHLQEITEDRKDIVLGRGRIADSAQRASSDELCLRAEHVSFSAQGRDILVDVSFDLYKGQRLVILGENGCGKTTLLKILARLISPSDGSVQQYIDEGIGKKPSARWFQLAGYVYQNPNYQLFMPQVEREIAYGAKDEEAIRRCLEDFSLSAMASRHPQSLSEGQKRRLCIAAILASMPQLLFLDEPTVGQDFSSLEHMVKTLNAIHDKTGMSMITVTHDARCAAALADRFLWLADGIVYASGGKELLQDYEKQAGRAF